MPKENEKDFDNCTSKFTDLNKLSSNKIAKYREIGYNLIATGKGYFLVK